MVLLPFTIITIPECNEYLRGRPVDINSKITNLPDKKYAVRSGAAKSLPGLMDTILFVERDKIEQQVIKVFESFKKVPENMRKGLRGTAVIIQQMAPIPPKARKKAGVVFPKVNNDKIEFIFRYSDKMGDDIVSGIGDNEKVHTWKFNTSILEENNNNTTPISKVFTNYVRNFGHPPDFELVEREVPKVKYFVQVRDYKTTPEESKRWVEIFRKYNIIPSKELVKRGHDVTVYTADSLNAQERIRVPRLLCTIMFYT